MIEVIAVYRVKRTRKAIRILTGATCTFQILTISCRKILKRLPTITKEEAFEITGYRLGR